MGAAEGADVAALPRLRSDHGQPRNYESHSREENISSGWSPTERQNGSNTRSGSLSFAH